MNKTLLLLLTFLMFLSASKVNADEEEWNYGIKMGVNLNKYDSPEIYYFYSAKRGLHFSFFCTKNYDRFRFQPGVMFIQKISTLEKYKDMVYTNSDHILSFLEIPIELSYKIVDTKIVDVYFNLEPYLGYCLKAVSRKDAKYTDLSIGRNNNSDLFYTNFGVRLGLGFMVSRFEPYFSYDLGLKDMSPSEGELTNKGFSFGIAFHF